MRPCAAAPPDATTHGDAVLEAGCGVPIGEGVDVTSFVLAIHVITRLCCCNFLRAHRQR